MEHRLSALLQLHLHSRLKTWLEWIGQRQLQDKTGNVSVWQFGASYIRDFTVHIVCCALFCCGYVIRPRFLSLTWRKLRICSANHRAGYSNNLAFNWLSIVWAYSWAFPAQNRMNYPTNKTCFLCQGTNSNSKSYRKFILPCFSVTCYKHVIKLWLINALDIWYMRSYGILTVSYLHNAVCTPAWLNLYLRTCLLRVGNRHLSVITFLIMYARMLLASGNRGHYQDKYLFSKYFDKILIQSGNLSKGPYFDGYLQSNIMYCTIRLHLFNCLFLMYILYLNVCAYI